MSCTNFDVAKLNALANFQDKDKNSSFPTNRA